MYFVVVVSKNNNSNDKTIIYYQFAQSIDIKCGLSLRIWANIAPVPGRFQKQRSRAHKHTGEQTEQLGQQK